jgi:hypothetical protein
VFRINSHHKWQHTSRNEQWYCTLNFIYNAITINLSRWARATEEYFIAALDLACFLKWRGSAMVQGLGRRHLIAETRFQSQVSTCEICDGYSALRQVFLHVLLFFRQSLNHCPILIHRSNTDGYIYSQTVSKYIIYLNCIRRIGPISLPKLILNFDRCDVSYFNFQNNIFRLW